jgi:hypothetical protein
MTNRPEKSTPKPKETRKESKGEHFEDVAHKLFKVSKTEIAKKEKKA